MFLHAVSPAKVAILPSSGKADTMQSVWKRYTAAFAGAVAFQGRQAQRSRFLILLVSLLSKPAPSFGPHVYEQRHMYSSLESVSVCKLLEIFKSVSDWHTAAGDFPHCQPLLLRTCLWTSPATLYSYEGPLQLSSKRGNIFTQFLFWIQWKELDMLLCWCY